ncbi:hypothetical protein BOTBODRAFT_28357 [Botryobasidium botryosum FD-172 SS1]|uniref:Uncharacterized protein n=1 Tax=Botryobasidium botryosum (strain FD-172 SS1) TaxID=930990 RepID=A0A067N442_BOTB1|nr:hypothetical protein BOTBODRAFT_28357 [Botryobasidium botryosum FD-172 SS1]
MLEKAPKRARYDLYDELMNIDDSDKNNLVAEEKSKESKGRKCEVSAPSLRLMVAMNQSHVAAGCYSGVKPGSGTSSRLRKNFRL